MAERFPRDRRRWVLLDAAVAGEDVLFVADNHANAQLELSRFGNLAIEHELPAQLVKRSTMELCFERGRVAFVARERIKTRLRRARFTRVLIDAPVSYWDRKDIKATGAKSV